MGDLNQLDGGFVLRWIREMAGDVHDQRDFLTQLDAAIGDADHGINMDRGFTAVKDELDSAAPADLQSILKTAATVLIRKVGGASGPLYGTFFLRAAAACAGKAELDSADVVAMFQAGIAGVREERGGSPKRRKNPTKTSALNGR